MYLTTGDHWKSQWAQRSPNEGTNSNTQVFLQCTRCTQCVLLQCHAITITIEQGYRYTSLQSPIELRTIGSLRYVTLLKETLKIHKNSEGTHQGSDNSPLSFCRTHLDNQWYDKQIIYQTTQNNYIKLQCTKAIQKATDRAIHTASSVALFVSIFTYAVFRSCYINLY